MGGFATAAAVLIAATAAGRVWQPIGFAAAAVAVAVWLIAGASRRHRSAEDPVQPGPYAKPQVFAGRQDRPARPPRNCR
jgi:hypothetical protein